MTFQYYFDDLRVGQVIELGSCSVDRDEVLEFAHRYDPQPFHIDEAAARDSIFGGLIASGWHTGAMVMRLMVDGFLSRSASMGSPGIDELRWLKPVRPGDTLSARIVVLEVKPSTSKPDRGVARNRWEVTNQDGELVMTMNGMGLFGKRPA
jgi:acyl dehydratase